MLNGSPGNKTKLQILSVKLLILMIGKQLMLSTNTCLIYGVSTQLIGLPIILVRKCPHSNQNIGAPTPKSEHSESHRRMKITT